MTLTCFAAWAVVLLIVPALLLLRLVEAQPEKIHRLRRQGWSQARIAERLGCTRHQVRKALATA